ALPWLVSGGGVHAAFIALATNAILWAALAGLVLRERHVDEDIAGEFASPLRDLRMWLLCSASTLVLAGPPRGLAVVRPLLPRHGTLRSCPRRSRSAGSRSASPSAGAPTAKAGAFHCSCASAPCSRSRSRLRPPWSPRRSSSSCPCSSSPASSA